MYTVPLCPASPQRCLLAKQSGAFFPPKQKLKKAACVLILLVVQTKKMIAHEVPGRTGNNDSQKP